MSRARQLLAAGRNLALAATYDIHQIPPPAPLMLYLELTRRCNLRCRHCDIWMSAGRQPGLTARELPMPALLGLLRELAGRGMLAVDFFGGEPLLRSELPELVAGAALAGLHVTVTSNGTLLTAERSRELLDAGLSQLLVSLDGPSAALHDGLRGIPGTFDRVTANLRNFVELAAGQARTGINALVCSQNFSALPAMVDLCRELGVGHLRLLPYHQCAPFNSFSQDDLLLPRPEELPALRQALDELCRRARMAGITLNAPSFIEGIGHWYEGSRRPVRCQAGLTVCDINARGELFACYPRGGSAGNVGQSPFTTLWHSACVDEIRRAGRSCTTCWQSCYVEPGLHLSARALLTDWPAALGNLREYLLGQRRR